MAAGKTKGSAAPSAATVWEDWNFKDKPLFGKEMVESFNKHGAAVEFALNNIGMNMELLAFNLYWIYMNRAYRIHGFDSIAAYASSRFDMSKSSVYNFISLVERFGERDEKGRLLPCFGEAYKDFSLSKLSLLTGLTDGEIKKLGIVPSMSVRDIKKQIRGSRNAGVSASPEPDTRQTLTLEDNEAVLPEDGAPEELPPDIPAVVENEDGIRFYIDLFQDDGERLTGDLWDELGYRLLDYIRLCLLKYPDVRIVISPERLEGCVYGIGKVRAGNRKGVEKQ